ncbi:oligosaccharide flippase family protein [Latilactobacillus curvatus]
MYKKLVKNSIIFAIGNLGSKFIAILLLPLYTYYLTTTQYGVTDLIITTCSLFLPLISLSIYDGVLRFIMDKRYSNDEVLSIGILITSIGSATILLIAGILLFFHLKTYIYLGLILVILQAFQALFASYSRAAGYTINFAINAILMAGTVAIFNVLFLVLLNMDIEGFVYSLVIANFVSIIIFLVTLKIPARISFSKVKRINIRKMLLYSMPLIPNAFMWWIMNVSNRYFITFFFNASMNGFFAVASKIPSLLNIVNSIFFQAWQMSAIEEYNSKEKNRFYSNVYLYYSNLMFIGCSVIIAFVKPLMMIIVAHSFYRSWKYVPFLLLAVLFSCFASFLATNYMASKNTSGVFKTSIYCGILNTVLNLLFIPKLGAIGAGLSTMLSFLFLWLIRIYDTRKFVKMTFAWQNIIGSLFLLYIQCLILYFTHGYYLIFGQLIVLVSIIYVNRQLVTIIKGKIFKNWRNI